jgi:hypothetical protein
MAGDTCIGRWWDSSETNHSFAAALLVYDQMRVLTRRSLIKRHESRREMFLDIALRIYPTLEHIRKNNGIFYHLFDSRAK